MIHVTLYDGLIPLIDEMAKRSLGLMSESLQVAGSKISKHARIKMNSQKTNWVNAFIDGKYRIWKSPSSTKKLGRMMSHKQSGAHAPGNVWHMLDFYLHPNGLTVSVGGAHPRFQPRAYKNGIHVGSYGDPVAAVGKRGRAIIHKLNTGELLPEHPYYSRNEEDTMIPTARYRGRHFMEAAFQRSQIEIQTSIRKRFEDSFHVAVNQVPITVIKRKLA